MRANQPRNPKNTKEPQGCFCGATGGAHPSTWQLCCGVGASFKDNAPKGIDFGENPPTMMQIEKMAQVIAILADALDLPIKFAAVATHAEVAIVDGYGPLSDDEQKRWDLWFLPNFGNDTKLRLGGVTIREKAQWYKELFERRIAA